MHLVLKRKPQQQIYINHPDGVIIVTVLNVSGANVSLGFNAPNNVMIERDDMRSRPEPSDGSHPCTKCSQPSWTLNGLCFCCDQAEQGD